MLRKLTNASLNSRASEVSPVFVFSEVEIAISNTALGTDVCLRSSVICLTVCR
jgi:hypothetical protein